MRYESLLSIEEKNHWLDLEVTIGTNEPLISLELAKLQKFLKSFDESEIDALNSSTGLTINPNSTLTLSNNSGLLKLLIVKEFINQHGLSIIREARENPLLSEKSIFLEITRNLFISNKYPEDIYVYSNYRRRGTPSTWFKVINNETPDQVEQTILDRLESLRRYINRHLEVQRKLRFSIVVGDLLLILFSKPISAKVIKGENKNLEAQRATYTILIFDKNTKKIGVVSGSKKEIQLVQRYIRYNLFKDSIATPRSDHEKDKSDLLKKLLASNIAKNISLKTVVFKSTLLPAQPSMRLKVEGNDSLDAALTNIERVWSGLGIDALKSVDYQYNGKNGVVYLYGDEWKRMFINVSAKRHSIEFENIILDDLAERLEVNVKESRFIVEPLTDEFILEKIFKDKKVPTFPPVPEKVEKLLVKLVGEKFIKKPTKIAKRKCQNCFETSWETWACPGCDRQEMTVVGEAVNVSLREVDVIRKLSQVLESDLPDHKVTLIPCKQRKNYKKTVIRLHNHVKNLSVFVLVIATKKDLIFAQDLLNEGFGIIAITDPEISGKIDHIQGMGCDIVQLHLVIEKLINGGSSAQFLSVISSQEARVLERIFGNLRTAIDRLNNKPTGYNEDLFEVDITNIVQAIVPDVVRLGTEYKGKKVPDGYCCYGYRTAPQIKRRRLFGWDAKYSFSASYRLNAQDLKKQKGYVEWLTNRINEPYKMGNLGIYGFISNFEDPVGFKSVLEKLATFNKFPNQCRLVLIEDKLLVKVAEWLLENWRQVLENNSISSEAFFKFVRKSSTNPYNIISLSDWDSLKEKLDDSIT